MNLKSRVELFDDAVRQGKKVAVCVSQDKDSAQFRYRCENIMELTLNSGEWQTVWFLNSEVSEILDRIDEVDLVVVIRQAAKDNKILRFIDEVKKHDIKVLFDLDDLVFDFVGLVALMNAIGSLNFLGWMGYVWGVRRIAKKVDGFLTTNDFLGGKLKRSLNKPYKVIKNSLNQNQVRVSRECIKDKVYDGFKIGYFSGSPTHIKDFRLVEPEIIKFLKSNSDVKLRVVGYMEFSKEMQKMIDTKKVEVLKSVDYLKLQELIAEVDVNIAPLVINDFTNCKSELKFFEAAVVETTTIASPAYTFKKAITDGKNGFLAQPGEWYDKLEYLYKHPEENRKIAKEAKKYALKHYYGKEFLKEVEEAYDFFAK